MMNHTVRCVTHVSRLLARLGGVLILLSAVLVSLDVVFRNLFKLSVFESFELTGYGIALATSFGFAWALITKAHIRIEVLYNALPAKARALLDLCAVGCLVLTASVLTFYAAQVVLDNAQLGARSNSTLHVPLAIPQGLWLVGLAWFAIAAAVLFVVALVALLTGRLDRIGELFGIASVAEEVEASMEGTGVDAGGGAGNARVGALNVQSGA